MLQLIAEYSQAHGSSRDRPSTASTLAGEGDQFLSSRTAKMRGHLVQQHRDGFDACFDYGLGTGKRGSAPQGQSASRDRAANCVNSGKRTTTSAWISVWYAAVSSALVGCASVPDPGTPLSARFPHRRPA